MQISTPYFKTSLKTTSIAWVINGLWFSYTGEPWLLIIRKHSFSPINVWYFRFLLQILPCSTDCITLQTKCIVTCHINLNQTIKLNDNFVKNTPSHQRYAHVRETLQTESQNNSSKSMYAYYITKNNTVKLMFTSSHYSDVRDSMDPWHGKVPTGWQ